ncbi:MAG: heme NO-binding domain-containing protein [Candidatus Aminicenantes bacterium]|nr:heme NO-binding domain-containing protein [Candidatus Aminicenantes bacterium]
MKAVIIRCLEKLIKENFGHEEWRKTLEISGFPRDYIFFSAQDIDDPTALKIVDSACEVLGITLEQAADVFGNYWVNNFAPNFYKVFYTGIENSRDFLIKLDKIHEIVTQNISGARPPRFDYEWKDKKTLIMTYNSHRGLIVFFVGLIKGVGEYFKEELKVTQLDDTRVEIVFQ